MRSEEGCAKEYERKGDGADLPTLSQLTGWGTPTVVDAVGRAYTYPSGNKETPFPTLVGQAMLSGEPGDSAQEKALASLVTPGTTTSSSTAGTARTGASRLNASFSLWLQGFPVKTWRNSSPGYPDAAWLEKLLEEFYARPTATGAAS